MSFSMSLKIELGHIVEYRHKVMGNVNLLVRLTAVKRERIQALSYIQNGCCGLPKPRYFPTLSTFYACSSCCKLLYLIVTAFQSLTRCADASCYY